jgi:rod shape-determining protein MreD
VIDEQEIWHRVDTGLRTVVPVVLTLILTLLSTLRLGIPGLGPVMPLLPAIAVFYWAIYRPDLMPLTATFAIGLVHDSLTGAPLGMTSLVLLVLQGLSGSQRKFFHAKGPFVSWFGFTLLAATAAICAWVVASAYYLIPMDPLPVAVQFAFTVAAYPLVAWPFGVIQRELLSSLTVRAR